MPKETFGGDDEGGGGEETKKLDLSKYGLGPDTNIRDLFWRIMASYAAAKKPGVDLAGLEHDRFALMRAALSILSRPHNQDYGLSPKFIARYTLLMLLDAGWEDAFAQFLEKSSETKAAAEVKNAMKNVLGYEKHRDIVAGYLMKMLRRRGSVGVALAYLVESKDAALTRSMKQELVILARGDVGENQKNAISLISLIPDDEDVRKSLIALLSHWDEGARLAAAKALEGSDDEAVKKAAANRIGKETSEQVLKALKRISK